MIEYSDSKFKQPRKTRNGVKLLKIISDIFDWVLDAMMGIICGLLLLQMLSITAMVISRNFLNRPISGLDEICSYSLVYVCFLGSGWVLKRKGHIIIDVVVNQLKPRTRMLLSFITSILGAMIFLVIIRYSAGVTWELFKSGERLTWGTLDLNKWVFILPISLGSFLLVVQFLRDAYRFLESWRKLKNEQWSPAVKSLNSTM